VTLTMRRGIRPGFPSIDAGIALGVGLIQVIGTYVAARHQHVHHPWDPLAVVLLAAGPAALVVRRRYPVAVLVVTLATALAYWVIGYGRGPLFVALIVAFITAVIEGHRVAAITSLVVGHSGFLWLGPLFGRSRSPTLASVVGLAAWLLVLFGVAEAIRVRRLRAVEAAHVREEESRRRVSEERLRIARELHDVLAHNISLINVQAATTLHRVDGGDERLTSALATIKNVSHETLVELRSLLGALREVDDGAPRMPTPSLARIDDLLATAAAAGLTARVEVRGTPRPLPASVDLAAYRIVQEALTNVARHADTSAATVQLTYGDGDLIVQIDDEGRASGPVTAGTGITGMTERATALNGRLDVGPRPGGGFRVRAWLPVRETM
jgi:signal transduction histidine kinase